jgi:hypothetical protein
MERGGKNVGYWWELGKERATKKNKIRNGVFWDVTPCGSCKNRRFGGT